MEQRRLGASGLRVSTLTLGTMTFGGRGRFADVGDTDLAGARRQLDMALDAGVTVIDTADSYSNGLSEEIVGEALGSRRDDILLSTKVRSKVGEGPNDAGASRHHVISGCEASLRRLRTDHIDIYHLHNWDGQTPLQETLEALDLLVSQGKVRYVACSNFTAWEMVKALGIADAKGLPRFVTTQIYYSLQERSAEFEILPACLDQGVGAVIWSPLAGGLLSGKYRRGVEGPAGSRHTTDWNEPPVYNEDALYDTVDVLVQVADAHGVSPARVALAWILTRPAVASVVIGARTEEQLADNLAASELALSDDELARLEQVSRPPLPYPLWHQVINARERFGPADLPTLQPYLDAS
ncbi:MAG TPA: aldo/keto reductase [Conexibacter sp.]|jgi:aryl-alcohol dehydrogenase-like predicted oxidoreductase